MNRNTENSTESRSVWTAPELKKIDIEALTAGISGGTTDSETSGNS